MMLDHLQKREPRAFTLPRAPSCAVSILLHPLCDRPRGEDGIIVRITPAVDILIRTLHGLRPALHSGSALAVLAVAFLRAVRAANGLLFRPDRRPPVSAQRDDSYRGQNKARAAIVAGMLQQAEPVPKPD